MAPVGPPPDRAIAPIGRLRLGVEIVATYLRVRRSLRRGDFRTTLAETRRVEPSRERSDRDTQLLGQRLGRATQRVLGPLPGDSRCLMQSLVLSGLLAHRGIDSKLILAVHPGESFAAHAWVEHEGCPLLEVAEPGFGRLVEL